MPLKSSGLHTYTGKVCASAVLRRPAASDASVAALGSRYGGAHVTAGVERAIVSGMIYRGKCDATTCTLHTQGLVAGPAFAPIDRRRYQQIDIHEADAATAEALGRNEMHHFVVRRRGGHRQVAEETEHLGAWSQRSARHFPHDEGVRDDIRGFEEHRQRRVTASQVVDPHGHVDENHPMARADARRRRPATSSGSDPANAARRRALSRAISASSPARTSAVFSSMFVRRRASSRK